MTEKSLSEKVMHSIDELVQTMKSVPDLHSDVLPFMEGTFFKIKQLSFAENNYESSYELWQIAGNYLPRTIHTYCSLPLEYRNTKLIKNNVTARDMLISDLQIIKKQVNELENGIYAQVEKEMRINSAVIKQKFEPQMQLAMQNNGEELFVNQFDLQNFIGSDNYHDFILKKPPPVKEPNEIAQSVTKATSTIKPMLIQAGKATIKYTPIVYNYVKTKAVFYGKKHAKFVPPVLFIGFFGCLMYGLVFMATYSSAANNYYNSVQKAANKIYRVQVSATMTPAQVNNLALSAYEEMTESSGLAKSNTKIITNDATVLLTAKNIDANQCLEMIDHYTNQIALADMKVNDIPVKKDQVFSSHRVENTESHRLCYMPSKNKVDFSFNAPQIYAAYNTPLSPEDITRKMQTLDHKIELAKVKSDGMSKTYAGEAMNIAIKMKQSLEINKRFELP